jgi:3-phenylpropionate/trans-cinnamate dioxygenase ferredoxin subunit
MSGGERYRLCAADDVPNEGIVRIVAVAGLAQPLAVARSGDEFFCIDDTCSHQDAALSDGWVEDGCVECPLHESRFDLRTGKPDVPPAKEPIATHPIIIENGVVYLLGHPL